MLSTDWNEVIEKFSRDEFEKALKILEDKGYVTDEDRTCIGKVIIKQAGKHLVQIFEKEGYCLLLW